jgi:multimeric flavodoxin WrbA
MTPKKMPVRIVGISSSPRHANSEILLKEALQAAQEAYPEIVTEFYSFKGKTLKPCLDCKACERRTALTLTAQCCLKDDWATLVKPLVDPVPNGVIIASPVYFSDVNSELRAFMERCTSLLKPYWFEEIPFEPPDFSKTVGGALAVGYHRHGGQETAILSILRFYTIMGMLSVGSVDPDLGPIGYFGGAAWEDVIGQQSRHAVTKDAWGLYSARVVGRKVARTAIMLAGSPDVPPISEPFVSHMVSHDYLQPANEK